MTDDYPAFIRGVEAGEEAEERSQRRRADIVIAILVVVIAAFFAAIFLRATSFEAKAVSALRTAMTEAA